MKRNILFSTMGWKSALSRERSERIEADSSKEDRANIVTSLRENPDNTHYPSEKLLHDTFADISQKINAERERATAVEERLHKELYEEMDSNVNAFNTVQSQFEEHLLEQEGINKQASSAIAAETRRAQEAEQQLDAKKADRSGTYPELTSGHAANLTGTERDKAQFSLRHTAGGTPVADGKAQIERIQGNSIVWNQHARAAESSTGDNVMIHSNGDGSYIVQTMVEESAAKDIVYKISESLAGCAGHRILFFGAPEGSASSTYCIVAEKAGLCDTGSGCMIESAQEGESFAIRIARGTNIDNAVIFRPQVFDLTRMFGKGREPSSKEEFRRMFPEAIYPYSSDRLLPMNACAIKSTSFNLFNGNYAAVLAHNSYYLGGTYASIGFSLLKEGNTTPIDMPADSIFTPAENGYIHASGSGICINLSHSERNGEYEEYTTDTRTLAIATYFPDGMKSVGSVCDEMTSEYAVKRIAARAYRNGDETNASVVTDGSETHYIMEKPEVTTPATAIDMSYDAACGGTEEVVYSTLSAPMKAEIRYSFNAQESIKENRKKIAGLEARIAMLEARIASLI